MDAVGALPGEESPARSEGGRTLPAPVNTSDLPPLATTKGEIKQKLGEGAGKLNVNKGSEKVGEICDVAIKSMKDTWVKLDERVPNDYTCVKRVTKALRDFEDPVKTARCSMGRIFFLFVTLWGLVFLILEIAIYDSIANLGAGAVTFLLGLFVTVFLGGDIFMFDAFRRIVDSLGWQIEILKASRVFYQQKLEDLKDVSEGLEEVRGQMAGDIDATTTLLTDMERLGKLRTVTSVVNLFHHADYDGDLKICGEEAELLLPQITILWEIVPGYNQQKVVEYVRTNGMTIKQFYPIVDALVQENEELAFRALEDLMNQTASEIAENLVPDEDSTLDSAKHGSVPTQLAPVAEHACAPSLAPLPKCSSGNVDEDELDAEAGASPVPTRVPEALHSMAPPTPNSVSSGSVGRQRSFTERAPEALKPLFTIPTPFPTRRLFGCVEIGGSMSVWGIWHLGALICVPFSILIFVFCVVEEEILYVVTAACLCCFTLALTGTGKLIEIVRVLRQQLQDFTSENRKLRDLNDGLAIQVAKLQKLKDGLMHLQNLCAGNADKAKELLAKSHMKSKMEAVGIVTRLFRMYDAGKDFKLSESQTEDFFGDLKQLFQHLPGFDMEKVKAIVGPGAMGHKKIREIVDVIVTFDAAETPAEAAAPTATPAEAATPLARYDL